MKCADDYSKYALDTEFMQDVVNQLSKYKTTGATVVLDEDWIRSNLANSSSEDTDCIVETLNYMIQERPELNQYSIEFSVVQKGKIGVKQV